MENPLKGTLVSILIPCYNTDGWLGQTIESALSQTWPNKEIIIVDDGSTDRSVHVARRYESKTVKVVSQTNRGAAAARNVALAYAQGDYIQWLDADDLLACDKIEKQMEVAGRAGPRVLLSSAWAEFYYRYRKAQSLPDGLWSDLSPVDWLIVKFSNGCWMSVSAWLVSRVLTDVAGPWDERLSLDDDGEYFCRVVAASDDVKFVSEAKSFIRRCNPGSLSRTLSSKALESDFLSRALCIKHLRSLEDSERTRKACVMLLRGGINYYYPKHISIVSRAIDLAREMGGELAAPVFNWRYSAATKLLGFDLASRIRRLWQATKLSTIIGYDKLLYNLSKR